MTCSYTTAMSRGGCARIPAGSERLRRPVPHRRAIGSGIGGPEHTRTPHHDQEKGRGDLAVLYPCRLINLFPARVSIRFASRPNLPSSPPARPAAMHRRRRAPIAWDDAESWWRAARESAICRVGVGGFAACRALSTGYTRPLKKLRVLRQGPHGFVIGEGAGVVVLENTNTRKKRGARIYAEVTAMACRANAYHVTSPAEDATAASAP